MALHFTTAPPAARRQVMPLPSLLRRLSQPVWRLIYGVYARRLQRQVAGLPLPRHVGIILDGNRRHAQARDMRNPGAIYRLGAAKLDDILHWSSELGIPMLTLWVFSPDNLTRPEAEIDGILGAIEEKMHALTADPHVHRAGVQVRTIGRQDMLPASLRAALAAAQAATRHHNQMILTLAVGYGGREEITDALRAFLQDCAAQGLTAGQAAAAVTPDAIRRHLYSAGTPDPDLIIRTSGEIRLSGFLLWQSVHSELYFCDANWPALRHIDFLRAIRSYQLRERRFGA
jgi:short-chain Z-isoprenyl diphosphate synthase